MSVVTTLALIAAHQRLIPGITTAFDHIPRSIAQGEQPAFITFPGRATYDQTMTGEQEWVDDRIYEMVLFGKLLTDGVEGEAETMLYPFIDAVALYFMDHRGLELNGVARLDSQIVGDSGIRTRKFPSSSAKEYSILPFQLRVRDLRSINDAV